jgi:carboxypeptidase C (cathepsin A)
MAPHRATAAAPLDKELALFQTRVSRTSLLWTLPWLLLSVGAHAADAKDAKEASKSTDAKSEDSKAAAAVTHFVPEQQSSKGSVTVEGRHIDYDAYAGTIVVHPKDWDDVPQNAPKDEDKNPRPEASMFYVAYFKNDKAGGDKTSGDKGGSDKGGATRPVTFVFNGGPGSSTVWLHMGAFGPRRVVTADDSHTPAAPYPLINNDYSLLDATDLVFVDAPGTGFSRIAGTDREKAFYGIDQDAQAFADFIGQFLSKYGRWNSAKYLFGESYGTTRSAVLIGVLETERFVDFNGVIMLSQILNFDASPDGPESNPGIELPYQLALPTYAATAWYHKKLPGAPPDLAALLTEVEHFAMTDYALALAAGSTLPDAQRDAIAAKLHEYTGLPVAYLLKANLRIDGGVFEKQLLDDAGLTVGRLDTRFSGPTMDLLSKQADYDPQSASISSAYVSVYNDYVRKELKYGQDKQFKPLIDSERNWSFAHHPPDGSQTPWQSTNVMPDLAVAMKYNPSLHVMLNSGYFDLATPFYAGIYEMQHLPIPATLQKNIEYAQYQSGHMVYAHDTSLKELHSKVADFIRRTQGPKSP